MTLKLHALMLMKLALVTAAFMGGASCGKDSNEPRIRINSFSVTPRTIGPDDTFTPRWAVDFYSGKDSIIQGYTMELHLNDKPEVNTSAQVLTMFASISCGENVLSIFCGSNGELTCKYRVFAGTPMLTCALYASESRVQMPYTGDVYMVVRACVVGTDLNMICDTESTPVTMLPPD